jgi:hypothetical protein
MNNCTPVLCVLEHLQTPVFNIDTSLIIDRCFSYLLLFKPASSRGGTVPVEALTIFQREIFMKKIVIFFPFKAYHIKFDFLPEVRPLLRIFLYEFPKMKISC